MCENKEIDKQWKKIFVQDENQIWIWIVCMVYKY